MALAILCSGQGHQQAGMFDLTGDAPAAAPLFSRATALLGGQDPRHLVLAGDTAALHRNRAAQILCVLQGLAAAAALRGMLPDKIVVAGYSVGELTSWGVAGVLGSADTLDLAAQRADAMDAASPPGTGLTFIRGLPRRTIDTLCERFGAAVAIVNPGDGFVVGGDRATLDALAAAARAMKAKRIVKLPVEVASHTPPLAAASTAFRERLGQVAATHPPDGSGARIISGIDGQPVLAIGAGLDKLAAQISQTVEWARCLEACIEGGATAFLELGPGSGLSEMVAGAWPAMPARSLQEFKSIDGVAAWWARYR